MIRKIVFSFLAVPVFASALMAANALQVGTGNPLTPYGPYQANTGGEFTLTAVPDCFGGNPTPCLGQPFDSTAYSTGVTSQTKGFGAANPLTNSFQTFCIEENETIFNHNEVYYFGIDDGAIQGGISGGNPDPVSQGTAYLYSRFASGALALDGYSYGDQTNAGTIAATTAARLASADLLQNAIWYLEGEKTAAQANIATNVFYLAALAVFTTDAATKADETAVELNTTYRVRALNLYADTAGTQFIQSQLTISAPGFSTPVPEPSTMALYGLGLLVLGGGSLIRRRRNQMVSANFSL